METKLSQWFSGKSFSKIIVLTDHNTSLYCLPVFSQSFTLPFSHISIPNGESAKNLENAASIWDQLLAMDADRNAILINLGGGMISDIGGFCASTYKRGIAFVNLPTTLLAMVDAAIGGKTGINVGHYKNQVGLFSNAETVFNDELYLKTLSEKELVAGYAEVLKYGLIYNTDFWEMLKSRYPMEIEDWQPVIDTCVGIKKQVVAIDPKEKGLRKILNFGHTIGHALESYSLEHDDLPLLHGEAVAIGIICESYLSHLKTGLSKTELEEISAALAMGFPKYSFLKSSFDHLFAYMQKDKKNRDNEISFVLLQKPGKAVYDIICTRDEIEASLSYYLSLHPENL